MKIVEKKTARTCPFPVPVVCIKLGNKPKKTETNLKANNHQMQQQQQRMKGKEIALSVNFDAVPEGCIANILSFTSPLDACNLSLVSPTFRSAASSDALWEKFLPPDYLSLIPPSNLPSSSSKKDIYINLCYNPVLIDDGKKSFWLEKQSGKKCYMLAAKDLMIAWGGTPQYWNWICLSESRFADTAVLKFVWWLEIRGKIDTSMLSPSTTYEAYLVCKFQTNASGLGSYPTEVSVGVIGSERITSTVCLSHGRALRQSYRRNQIYASQLSRLQGPERRRDGWYEIKLGEYFNENGEDGELEMTVMEVKAPKHGLVVQGIEIRPKRS